MQKKGNVAQRLRTSSNATQETSKSREESTDAWSPMVTLRFHEMAVGKLSPKALDKWPVMTCSNGG